MLFSSLEFLFLFLPLFLLAYFAAPLRHRKAILILGSLVFYTLGDPRALPFLALSVAVNFALTRLGGKLSIAVCAVWNVGLLVFFKYLTSLPMPLGLSFYSFTAIAGVAEAAIAPAKPSFSDFTLSLVFFPKLLSGPITRGTLIGERPNTADAADGIGRFLCGLGKKLLLATPAGALWDYFRTMDTEARGLVGGLVGLAFYAFFLYYDFSGYTDMALGLGRILGYRLPENFHYPYIATSARDFWRRWHISLSSFFRDLVYIPLGGSRCPTWRVLLNLLAVWLLTGLWHGSTLNFAVWGIYWFLLLAIERLFLGKILERLPVALRYFYSLPAILLSWLIFALPDMTEGTAYLTSLFSGTLVGSLALYEIARNAILLVFLILGATPLPKRFFERYRGRLPALIGMLACFVLSLAYLLGGSYAPFLYLQF